MEKNESKKKPIYKKWWFWVIVVFILGGIAAGSSNNTTLNTEVNSQQQVQEEIIEVDYKILHQEYMDNPISADAKYKGKILKLTGPVNNIDREIAGNTYITFEIGFLENVRITFKKSEEGKVAQLSKGQTVTIKGRCTGTLLSSTVALDDCEIIN